MGLLRGQARAFIRLPKLSGQAQAQIRRPKYMVYDQFNRSVASSWGTPNIGPAYSTYLFQNNSNINPFDVNVNYGSVGLNLPTSYTEVLSPINSYNEEIFVKIIPQNVSDIQLDLVGRLFPPNTVVSNVLNQTGVHFSFNEFGTDISPYISVSDAVSPETITDRSVTWRRASIYIDDWAALSSYPLDGSVHRFGVNFWQQSGTGLSGGAEPDFTAAGPHTDGDLTWAKLTTTWAASTAYTLNQLRLPTVYTGNIFYALVPGTSNTLEPDWPYEDWTDNVIDNNFRWILVEPDRSWNSVFNYSIGSTIATASVVWEVTASAGAGESGSTEPNWTIDGPITDGDLTWERVPTWVASTSYSQFDIVQPTTPNSFYYEALSGGTSGSTQPSFPLLSTHGGYGYSSSDSFDPVFTDGIPIYVKVKLQGTYVYAKVWQEGSEEPSAWQIVLVPTSFLYGQAQALVRRKNLFGQAQAQIRHPRLYGQAQALIYKNHSQLSGQARAFIYNPQDGFGPVGYVVSWTQDTAATADVQFKLISVADVNTQENILYGQAAARIRNPNTKLSAQAQALIRHNKLFAQAQATILPLGYRKMSAQAQAMIRNTSQPDSGVIVVPAAEGSAGISGGAGTGGSIVNEFGSPVSTSFRLAGYLQSEGLVSDMDTGDYYSPYSDGSRSEYLGLTNKSLPITMRIWKGNNATLADLKADFEETASYLRTAKGYMRLYLYYPDKYYEVLTQDINYDKSVDSSSRILDYNVDFEAKPWLYSVSGHTLTGTGTLVTSGRTIDNGGWTPTIVQVTGTDVTISGFTATDFTGFITISGAVTNMIIDTERGQATIGGQYANHLMYDKDFSLYVGPGETTFVITGASSCVITYKDRWYL